MRFEIDRIAKDDMQVLGPGKRMEIWLHGCQRRCPGCIIETHNREEEPMLSLSVNVLMNYLSEDAEIEGVTISGGEPFLQADALLCFSKLLHEKHFGIILYSGYTYQELQDLPLGKDVLAFVDVLVDGPYIQELDDGVAYRGSSNQKIYCFTDRYVDYFSDCNRKRKCYIKQQGAYLSLTGIPDRRSRQIWNQLKSKGE